MTRSTGDVGPSPADRPGVGRVGRLTLAAVVGCFPPAGCHTPHGIDQGGVSHAVEARFGQPVGGPPRADRVLVPDGLEDGRPLTEDQSVLLALWNNALFHEALVELDLTRADLVQAGLLPNPELFYQWPASDKPYRYLIDFPIESLYLRPIRVKAAAAENERAAGRVTQLALDLIRDARQAFADLRLAQDRVAVFDRAVELRTRVAELTAARLEAGVGTEQEVATARIDLLLTTQDRIRAGYDRTAAIERFRFVTGLSGFTFPLVADDAPFDPRTEVPLDDLVAEAVRTRPDALAAEVAVAAAAERVRISRLSWFRFLGVADGTSGRKTGHEVAPAVRLTIPIFNQNQGAIARARAELEQLERRRLSVRNQIVLDVRAGYARYQQARSELDLLRKKTRPEAEAAIVRADAGFKEGDVTYLIVLEANRQLIEAYSREAALTTDLRRFWAELERGVGRRLTPSAGPAP